MEIATIGEAVIDFKATDGLSFDGFVGGCHVNVAVAAARLGASVGFAGQISRDFFGDAIRAHLEKNGVRDGYVVSADAPTTLAFVSERGGDAHFQFFRENAADLLYDPRPRPSFPPTLAFLMFGSISLLHEPARSAILDVVEAHRSRCTTILDPNIRPLVLPDRKAYAENVETWVTLADLVKVSAQDLGWLYPDTAADDVVARWLNKGGLQQGGLERGGNERGPSAVIVTRGGSSIDLHRSGRDVLSIRPPQIETVDTVGAGDTFTGALMATLTAAGIRGAPATGIGRMPDEAWREALSTAADAAALNCTRAGANPPTVDELERFRSREAR